MCLWSIKNKNHTMVVWSMFFFLFGWIQELYTSCCVEVFKVCFLMNVWLSWFWNITPTRFFILMYVSFFNFSMKYIYTSLCQLLFCMFSQPSPQIRLRYYISCWTGIAAFTSAQHMELNLSFKYKAIRNTKNPIPKNVCHFFRTFQVFSCVFFVSSSGGRWNDFEWSTLWS